MPGPVASLSRKAGVTRRSGSDRAGAGETRLAEVPRKRGLGARYDDRFGQNLFALGRKETNSLARIVGILLLVAAVLVTAADIVGENPWSTPILSQVASLSPAGGSGGP